MSKVNDEMNNLDFNKEVEMKGNEVGQEKNNKEDKNKKDKNADTDYSPKQGRKKRKKIDSNEEVICRSIATGRLIYISKHTGLTTIWSKFGDEEALEYGELRTMKASQPGFLTRPLIIVEDDEVVEALGLKELYRQMVDIENIGSFFKKSAKQIKEDLRKSPKGVRQLVGSKAREMIESGELHDIRKIKALEEELKIDLTIFME